jgi:hypothetical protein
MTVIRKAMLVDCTRIGEIGRSAFAKYVSRIGREPAPMLTDFSSEIAAGHVEAIAAGGDIAGCMIAWPEAEAYSIDAIAVDPPEQGKGVHRPRCRGSAAPSASGLAALYQ